MDARSNGGKAFREWPRNLIPLQWPVPRQTRIPDSSLGARPVGGGRSPSTRAWVPLRSLQNSSPDELVQVTACTISTPLATVNPWSVSDVAERCRAAQAGDELAELAKPPLLIVKSSYSALKPRSLISDWPNLCVAAVELSVWCNFETLVRSDRRVPPPCMVRAFLESRPQSILSWAADGK